MRKAGSKWALAVVFVASAALAEASCTALEGGEPLGEVALRAPGAPRISPDFPVVAPAFSYRTDVPIVTAAAGTDSYLLVYHLARVPNDHRLIGSRVRASDGALLDAGGFTIAVIDAPVSAIQLVSTFTGSGWLLVYVGEGNELRSVTVGTNGVASAPLPLGISGTAAGDVTWGGDRALLTTRTGRGLFLNADGSPLGAPFTIFPLPPAFLESGISAFDGTHFLVGHYAIGPTFVRLFSVASTGPTGKSADLYSTTRTGAQATLWEIESDGAGYLAQYTASPPTCAAGGACVPLREYYQPVSVSPTGDVSAGTPRELAPPRMRVMVTNGSYVLDDGVNVLRVDSSGLALGPSEPLLRDVTDSFLAVPLQGPSLIPGPSATNALAISGPLAARLDDDYAALDDPLLAPLELPRPQRSPSAVFDGSNYLAVWQDDGRGGVRATRVSGSGSVIDQNSFGVASGRVFAPFAASNGTSSLVAWLGDDDLGAARVGRDGGVTAVDLANLQAPFVTSAALASNGTDYLVVWTTPVLGSDPPVTRAGRVPATGLPSAPIELSPSAEPFDVAYDGANYVFVQAELDGNRRELTARRISGALQILDTPARPLLDYAASLIDPAPVVASNGTESLVVWFDGEGETVSTIRCARVTRDLTVLDPSGVTVGTGSYSTESADVAWDGSRYWIVWNDRPIGSRTTRLLGRRVSSSAVPVDPAPFVVASTLGFPNVALARGPDDQLLLLSVRDVAATDEQSVRGRFLNFDTGGAGGEAGSGGAAGEAGSAGAPTGGASTGGSSGATMGGQAGDDTGGDAGTTATGGAGSPGTGGTSSGEAGHGDAGRGGSGPGGDDSGCDCTFERRAPTPLAALFAALLVSLGVRRRVRRELTNR
jgi:hypothetical protein